MKTITTFAAALLAAGLTAASGVGYVAHAQEGTRTVAIHYGDLDLGSAAGRKSLNHRIRHAVRAACGEASPADLKGRNETAACRADLNSSLAVQRDAAFAAAEQGRSRLATLVARR
jgi:UrcA family protein